MSGFVIQTEPLFYSIHLFFERGKYTMKKFAQSMNHTACMAFSFMNQQVRFFAGWYWCAYYYENTHKYLNEWNAAA
jgi:hypothetical protein